MKLGPHLTRCRRGPSRIKWHANPSNRLATIHQRRIQTRQTDIQTDRQRSDSIARTVLQTVAQKSQILQPTCTRRPGYELLQWILIKIFGVRKLECLGHGAMIRSAVLVEHVLVADGHRAVTYTALA